MDILGQIGNFLYEFLTIILDAISWIAVTFWSRLLEQWQWLASTINPWGNFGDAVLVAANMLPAMDPNTPYFIQSITSSGSYLFGSLALLSYFIDLNFAAWVLGFIMIAEAGLIPYRAWLVVKRAIPFLG